MFGEMSGEKKPCRTCTDFKTWAKHQQNVYKAKSEVRQFFSLVVFLNENVQYLSDGFYF